MAMQVGSGGREDAPMVEMNMTPLIDVLLVLLIMFIITIPIQTHAVKMNMPIPSNAQPKEPRPPIRIDVDFFDYQHAAGHGGEDRAGLPD